MESIVLWQHKWSADIFIPTYLFFGGLTAGVLLVACVTDLLSIKFRRLETLSRLAGISAVPLLALAGFFLTIHLGKPERGLGFPLFFTNYNSWMTRGGWIVGTDAPIVIVYASLWYFRVLPGLRRVLALLGIPAQIMLAMYTGFLLSGAEFVPLWSSKFLPLLFLNSGLTTGVAASGLILLVAWWCRRLDDNPGVVLRWLNIALVLLILLELFEVRSFMNYLAGGAPDKAVSETIPTGKFRAATGSRLAYEYVTGGPDYPWKFFAGREAQAADIVRPRENLARWFWFGIIGLGLTLPLVLALLEFLSDLFSPRLANQLAAIKFTLVLAGGYILRLIMVWGGDIKAPLPYPPSMWPIPGIGGPPIPGLGG
jgi:formate-dependent nitrite reductase membrane component NrfD